MKIFISQKPKVIDVSVVDEERQTIEERFTNTIFNILKVQSKDQDMHIVERPYWSGLVVEDGYGNVVDNISFVNRYYNPNHLDDIHSLKENLAYIEEADIVLVPKMVKTVIKQFQDDFGRSQKMWGDEFTHLKGCEFEFLIAKSYGKKVYTYDEAYNFEEV